MKIAIASDHAGFKLKEEIKKFINRTWGKGLNGKSLKILDYGAHDYEEGDDYPDYISKAAHEVAKDPEHVRAIVIGGSGQGEAMASNRYRNVRATVYYGGGADIVKISREDNDSNVLSIGARFVSVHDAEKAVQIWLTTKFSGEERHIRRIKKIECMPHSHTRHD